MNMKLEKYEKIFLIIQTLIVSRETPIDISKLFFKSK